MKGVLKKDHISVNKYRLGIKALGLEITPTEVGGIEEELETTELPDRTKASGGNTKATEFTVKIPMHHTLEVGAMEFWFAAAQDPVSPAYKYSGTLSYTSMSGAIIRGYLLYGMFPTKRTLPDGEMSNEGELATIEYTISVDLISSLT